MRRQGSGVRRILGSDGSPVDSHVTGISISGFVQLIQSERKTCTLLVLAGPSNGALTFEKGELLLARTLQLAGNAAAIAIFQHQDCTIDVVGWRSFPGPVVTASIAYLLLEAARRADEGIDQDTPDAWETVNVQPGREREEKLMASVEKSVQSALKINGCTGAAVVDFDSGMCLGFAGAPGFDLELAAAGNAEVVRAKKSIRDKLGLKDKIEDILISLTGQYHLIRMVGTTMFFYVVLDRSRANLAMARKELETIEKALDIERA